MAVVGAPHGVRGAVKLTVFAEEPLSLRRYNPFDAEDGRSIRLASVKWIGKAVVAQIEGVADRDAAEALRGLTLSVLRSRLPRPDDDEFYHVDLIGLAARLRDGTPLGTVRGVADYGAGDILEVGGERTVLVPFTRAVVPEVSIAQGYLVVDPPPGLLEDIGSGDEDIGSGDWDIGSGDEDIGSGDRDIGSGDEDDGPVGEAAAPTGSGPGTA